MAEIYLQVAPNLNAVVRPAAIGAGSVLPLTPERKKTIEEAVVSLGAFMNGMMSKLEKNLKTVSVEFGINASAEAGVILAKGSVESHIQVTLEWELK